jgi:hypothetical protein
MTTYLGNAFSLNMFKIDENGMRVEIQPVLPSEIPANAKSIVGHADMAAVVSSLLGREVTVNRESVTLQAGDILFVAQYHGPRLPAGATKLPSGARIEFYRITTHSSDKREERR